MSITWFITPYDPKYWEDPEDKSEKPTSDLNIDPVSYIRQIIKIWPEATFDRKSDTFHSIHLPNIDEPSLRISLSSKNQVIAINNNPTPTFFEFILFHRAFVPIKYHLFFFNSSAWRVLKSS